MMSPPQLIFFCAALIYFRVNQSETQQQQAWYSRSASVALLVVGCGEIGRINRLPLTADRVACVGRLANDL